VPLIPGERDIFRAALDELAHAFMEGPEHYVVFHAVETHGEIIAVGFQVEKNPRALIELAGDDLETHADLAVVKVRDVFGDGVGKVSPCLYIVDKLFIARSVNRTCFLGQATRRLAAQPRTAIHAQHFLSTIFDDRPIANHGKKFG
jgi:hypothetical protein